MIGGIQSNLVNGLVWFNIKPNYFISINDPNLENTIRIRIKTTSLFTCSGTTKKYVGTCYCICQNPDLQSNLLKNIYWLALGGQSKAPTNRGGA